MRKFPVVPRGIKIFDQSEFCISTVVFKFWGWAWGCKGKEGQEGVFAFFLGCVRVRVVFWFVRCTLSFLSECTLSMYCCSCLRCSYFFSFLSFVVCLFLLLFIVFALFLLLLLFFVAVVPVLVLLFAGATVFLLLATIACCTAGADCYCYCYC